MVIGEHGSRHGSIFSDGDNQKWIMLVIPRVNDMNDPPNTRSLLTHHFFSFLSGFRLDAWELAMRAASSLDFPSARSLW
jgi:hypothetical protein